MKVEQDDLHAWLVEHKDEIDYVVLTWTWPEIAQMESSFMGTVYGEKNWPLDHRFSFTRLDDEYSFAGGIEDAIEFTKSYDCWDGHDLELVNGILFGEHEGYNPDMDEYPEDADALEAPDVFNISYMGLYYHMRERNNYTTRWYDSKKNPIYRERREDE